MHSLQFKIHDIRYKVDYLKARYKQRYYSNDRNPRVIQTKLKNQRLLSLRTQPHDKYFIKPGEFLALVPKRLNKISNQIIQLDTSEYLKPQFLKQKDLFQWYDDNAIKEYSYSNLDLDLEHHKFGKIRSYSNSCIEIPTAIKDDNYVDRVLSSHEDKPSLNSSSSIDNRSGEEKIMGISSNSSFLIDMNSFTPGTRITNISNGYSDKGLYFASFKPDFYDNTREQFLSCSKIKSTAPDFQSFHTRESTSNSANNIVKLQSSWRMVRNVISLSAAMVAVGQSPTLDIEDLTADFTIAKPKNFKDYYIKNTCEDKENYDSSFGKTEWEKRVSDQGNFNDGNILINPTITSLTQSHYYKTGGVLSMYNYSSDNDSTF